MTQYSTAQQLGVNLQQTYTPDTDLYPYASSPGIAAGELTEGTDGSVYVYVLASGAIALGDVVTITNAYVASGITTTNAALGNRVGVASQVAIPDTAYGWVQLTGKCEGLNVAASCLPNVQLAATSTAGKLDDAVTTGLKNITGVIITATNTATTFAAKAGTLNFPVVGTTNS